MPKIELKPNSVEYADDAPQRADRCCDMPGCAETADYKAPKDRTLGSHYWFCLEHVQDYNRAWNYFSGMGQADIEDHIIRSALWDRPTWRYGNFPNFEEELKNKAWQTFHFSDKPESEPESEQQYSYDNPFIKGTPEHEAMAIMGLTPPLRLERIKTRYKTLAKKYHPDINRDNPDAEETLKRVNIAYTVLRLACERYEALDK